MTGLRYNKRGELTAFDTSGARRGFILFKIEGKNEGILELGGTPFKLSEGYASVRLSCLCDGDYTPKCHTGEGSLSLEPIRIRGNVCQPLPPSTEQLIGVRERITALEEQLRSVSGELSKIRAQLGSNTIF